LEVFFFWRGGYFGCRLRGFRRLGGSNYLVDDRRRLIRGWDLSRLAVDRR
jgi:hypothetical protein